MTLTRKYYMPLWTLTVLVFFTACLQDRSIGYHCDGKEGQLQELSSNHRKTFHDREELEDVLQDLFREVDNFKEKIKTNNQEKTNARNAIIRFLKENKDIDINAECSKHMPIFNLAVCSGDAELVQAILERNPNLEWKGKYGDTALNDALSRLISQENNLREAQRFIEDNRKHYSSSEKGSPLVKREAYCEIATNSVANYKEIIWTLLNNGADINTVRGNGMTLLMCAAALKDMEIFKKILNGTNDINTQEQRGHTALHWAAIKCNVEALEMIVNRGAAVYTKNKREKTPLLIAVENIDYKAASILLAQYKTDPVVQAIMQSLLEDLSPGIKQRIQNSIPGFLYAAKDGASPLNSSRRHRIEGCIEVLKEFLIAMIPADEREKTGELYREYTPLQNMITALLNEMGEEEGGKSMIEKAYQQVFGIELS